jgi:hypothetical protein
MIEKCSCNLGRIGIVSCGYTAPACICQKEHSQQHLDVWDTPFPKNMHLLSGIGPKVNEIRTESRQQHHALPTYIVAKLHIVACTAPWAP